MTKHYTIIIDVKETVSPTQDVHSAVKANSEFGKVVKEVEDVAHFVIRGATQIEAVGKAIRLLDILRNEGQ